MKHEQNSQHEDSSQLHERWSVRIGGGFQEVLPIPDGTGDVLCCDMGGVQRRAATGALRWQSVPFGAHGLTGIHDLDADGHLEIITTNGTELLLLDAVTGIIRWRQSVIEIPIPSRSTHLQSYGTYAGMIHAHHFFGTGMQLVVPLFVTGDILVLDCSAGVEHTTIAHVLHAEDAFHPTIAIGDVNHDGTDEIVVARLGGVYVYSPITGLMLSKTIWSSDETRRRNYGHFELVDLDGDGDLEAVIISDRVSRHIAVLDNDGSGNLAPRWDRFIQHIYPTDTTELRYVTNSITTLDTAGTQYIVVSIFSEHGDERWHTEVLSPLDGSSVATFDDYYLRGIADANGDGIPELCLSYEERRIPRTYSPLVIASLTHGILWTYPHGAFAERKTYTTTRRGEFKPDVFQPFDIWTGQHATHNGLFLLTPSHERVSLSLLTKSLERWPLPGDFPTYSRIAHHDESQLLVCSPDGCLTQIHEGQVTAWYDCGYHLSTEAHSATRPGPVASLIKAESHQHIVVPSFANTVQVYSCADNREPELTAIINGHGVLGYDVVYHRIPIIKYNNDAVLGVCDDLGLEHARLSLYRFDGTLLRSYDFAEMPPTQLGTRIGAYEWLPFDHSRGPALFISFFQSASMNSEVSLAILLNSGETLWKTSTVGEGEYGRGVGAWSGTTIVDGMAVICAKDLLVQISLETGQSIGVPLNLTELTAAAMKRENRYKEQGYATWSSIDDPFTAYGTPMRFGNRTLVAANFGGMGMIENNAASWWHVSSFGDVLYKLPAAVATELDGELLGQPHADGSFSIIELKSGKLLHTLNLGGIGSNVTTGKFAHNRSQDFVLGTNDGRILLVSASKEGAQILAAHNTPASMGSPSVVDIDGDGKPEILAVSADGYLRCFDYLQ